MLKRKAPHHESDMLTHMNGLLYKHVMDASQKFLALGVLKSWHFTVLIEIHDKLDHCSNMQMSTSPMTQFWSTDSAPTCKCPSPQSNMLMQ